MVASIGLGHEDTYVAADHLLRRVTEEPLGCRVERLDTGPLADRDDPIDDVVHHCPKPLLGICQLFDALLQLLRLGLSFSRWRGAIWRLIRGHIVDHRLLSGNQAWFPTK